MNTFRITITYASDSGEPETSSVHNMPADTIYSALHKAADIYKGWPNRIYSVHVDEHGSPGVVQ